MNSPAGFTPDEERELQRREAYFEDLGPLPTSDHLRDFRRSIAASHTPGFYTYTPSDKAAPWFESPPNGTERRWGIPASYDRSGDYRRAKARRMAAKLRSDTAAFLFANLPDGQP